MSQWREQWSEQEWVTLRLAPVWVLSALAGRIRFDDDERGAFWDAVTERLCAAPAPDGTCSALPQPKDVGSSTSSSSTAVRSSRVCSP